MGRPQGGVGGEEIGWGSWQWLRRIADDQIDMVWLRVEDRAFEEDGEGLFAHQIGNLCCESGEDGVLQCFGRINVVENDHATLSVSGDRGSAGAFGGNEDGQGGVEVSGVDQRNAGNAVMAPEARGCAVGDDPNGQVRSLFGADFSVVNKDFWRVREVATYFAKFGGELG